MDLGVPLSLATVCHRALASRDPAEKLAIVAALARGAGDWSVRTASTPNSLASPGRPDNPVLVDPRQLPKRSVATAVGRAALIHALAHIEFNAIHLALDACWRFPDLPRAFYLDWLRVAHDEARHFALLDQYLRDRGYRYGSFVAHNGLWEMAEATAHDPLARMALVPRVMEARGLDVTPGLRARFQEAGDVEAVSILDVILADEIEHVAIGNRWFQWLCADRRLDPQTTFLELCRRHRAPRPHLPLNRDARRASGFSDAEMDAISTLS